MEEVDRYLSTGAKSFVEVAELIEVVVSFLVSPLPDVQSITNKNQYSGGGGGLYNPVSSLRYYSGGAGGDQWARGVKELYLSFQLIAMLKTISKQWEQGCKGLWGACIRSCMGVYKSDAARVFVRKTWEDSCTDLIWEKKTVEGEPGKEGLITKKIALRPNLVALRRLLEKKMASSSSTNSGYRGYYSSSYSSGRSQTNSQTTTPQQDPLTHIAAFWGALGAAETNSMARYSSDSSFASNFKKVILELEESFIAQEEAVKAHCGEASSSTTTGGDSTTPELTLDEKDKSIGNALEYSWCLPSMFTLAMIGLSASRWSQGFPSDTLKRVLGKNVRLCAAPDFDQRMRPCCQPIVYVPGEVVQKVGDPVTKLVVTTGGIIKVEIGGRAHPLRAGSFLGGGAFTPEVLAKAVSSYHAIREADRRLKALEMEKVGGEAEVGAAEIEENKALAKKEAEKERGKHKASGRYEVEKWVEAWMVDRDKFLEEFQIELAAGEGGAK